MSEQEQNDPLEQTEAAHLGQAQDAAPVEETSPALVQEAPEATDAAPPAQEAPAAADATAPGQEKPGTKAPEAAPAAKKGKAGVLTDVLLVLVLLAVLGFGGVYISDQMSKNRIPSAMEQAMQENEALTQELIALTPAYNDAKVILDLYEVFEEQQTKISAREHELMEENRTYAEMERKCEAARQHILALQYDIRQADEKLRRDAARCFHNEIYVGTIRTRTGKTYQNASIANMSRSRLTIKSPTARATIKTSDLDANDSSLPRLLRYALGTYDIIDLSSFDATPYSPMQAAPQRPAPAAAPAPAAQSRNKNYTPRRGAPVVDTRADEPVPPAPSRPQVQQTDDGLAPY